MSDEMETAIAVGGVLITAGGAIAGYTVMAVRGATAGVIEAVRGLAKSVDLLRSELVSLRAEHYEVAKVVAVLKDAHENGG